MRRTPWLLGLATLGLAALVAAPASSTIVQYMDVEQMSELASVVAVGEVERVAAGWNASHTKIYTRVTIATSEILKGDRDLETLTIKTIGGQVGDTVAELPGTPRLEPGERVLLFLEPREDGDGYLVLGLFQGLFKLSDDDDDGDILYQDLAPPGVSIVDTSAHPAASKMYTLIEVRRIVKGGS